MSRIPYGLRRAIREGLQRGVRVELDHPDGIVRVWTGIGTLHTAGEDWLGIGSLGKISGVTVSTRLGLKEVQLELSGVEPDAAVWLDANVRNRQGKAWMFGLDRSGRVLRHSTMELFDVTMDYQELIVGDSGDATVRITAVVGYWNLRRAVDHAWTNESQQDDFPGDTGLSLIPELVDANRSWTRT